MSVERLQELENGKVEWRMATSSTPGGRIPQFVVESSMASTISKVGGPAWLVCEGPADIPGGQDVTHFLEWLHKQPKDEAAPGESAATGDAPPATTADVLAVASGEPVAPNAGAAEASGPGAAGAVA